MTVPGFAVSPRVIADSFTSGVDACVTVKPVTGHTVRCPVPPQPGVEPARRSPIAGAMPTVAGWGDPFWLKQPANNGFYEARRSTGEHALRVLLPDHFFNAGITIRGGLAPSAGYTQMVAYSGGALMEIVPIVVDATMRSYQFAQPADEIRLTAPTSNLLAWYLSYLEFQLVPPGTWQPAHRVLRRQCRMEANGENTVTYTVQVEDIDDIPVIARYAQHGLMFTPPQDPTLPDCLNATCFVDRVTWSLQSVTLEGKTSAVALDDPVPPFFTDWSHAGTIADFARFIAHALSLSTVHVDDAVDLDTPIDYTYPLGSMRETLDALSDEAGLIWHVCGTDLWLRKAYRIGQAPEDHEFTVVVPPVAVSGLGDYRKVSAQPRQTDFAPQYVKQEFAFGDGASMNPDGLLLSVLEHDLTAGGVPVRMAALPGPTVLDVDESRVAGQYVRTYSVKKRDYPRFIHGQTSAGLVDRIRGLARTLRYNRIDLGIEPRPGQIGWFVPMGELAMIGQVLSATYTAAGTDYSMVLEVVSDAV